MGKDVPKTERARVTWVPVKRGPRPEMTEAQMIRRIEELERRNPLRNNNILILAVEQAFALLRGKGFISRRTKSLLTQDKDYFRRFMALALDPSISKAEMARRLGVHEQTIEAHLQIVNAYLHTFLAQSHNLKEEGYGWVEDE